MIRDAFRTPEGQPVTAVSANEMRSIDRDATETAGLDLRQMMENAGRTLASHAVELHDSGPIVVLAGSGGNGGGGLVAARHLSSRVESTVVVLDREPSELTGAAEAQHRILGSTPAAVTRDSDRLDGAGLIVDALVGYGLDGPPRGAVRTLIEAAESIPTNIPTLSLDVPSGRLASEGTVPGVAVTADRTVTLALPKMGLREIDGELFLADIGIPDGVFSRMGIPAVAYKDRWCVRLQDTSKPDLAD